MSISLNTVFITTQFYQWLILGAGLLCLTHYCALFFIKHRYEKGSYSTLNRAQSLALHWRSFLLFFWILLIVLFLVTTLITEVYSWLKVQNTEKNKIPVFIQGLFMQLSILLTLLIYKFQSPHTGLFSFSAERLSFSKKIISAGYYFLLSMPILIALQLILKRCFDYWEWDLPQQQIIETIAQTQSIYSLILITLMIVILAPLTEELLFRGIIYRFLKNKMGIYGGAIISAALFAFAHFNLFSFMPLFLLGLLLTLSYESSGNITTPILFHAFFNANSMIFILTNVSNH